MEIDIGTYICGYAYNGALNYMHTPSFLHFN